MTYPYQLHAANTFIVYALYLVHMFWFVQVILESRPLPVREHLQMLTQRFTTLVQEVEAHSAGPVISGMTLPALQGSSAGAATNIVSPTKAPLLSGSTIAGIPALHTVSPSHASASVSVAPFASEAQLGKPSLVGVTFHLMPPSLSAIIHHPSVAALCMHSPAQCISAHTCYCSLHSTSKAH